MAFSEGFVPHDRAARFREYTEHRSRGGVEIPPTQPARHERRQHVRHPLLDDHRSWTEHRPDGAQRTFDPLDAA